MCYLLNVSQLRVGDIVLESGNTKFISGAIKNMTGSNYSHAMIYVGNTIIHATSGGVFSKNPQRLIVGNIDDLKVLRCNHSVDDFLLHRITGNARSKVGSLYSVSEAIGVVVGLKNKTNKQFCSRLVAQSYAEVGISLVCNPDFCSPEELNVSPLLYEVPNCVRKATEADIEFANRPDPMIKHQEETYKWLNKARDSFSKHKVNIQTINNVTNALINNGQLDEQVCSCVMDTEYLSMYDFDRGVNKYRYSYELFSLNMNGCGLDSVYSELKFNVAEYNRYIENYLGYCNLYKKYELRFIRLHVDLYKNLLSEIFDRISIIRRFLIQNASLFAGESCSDFIVTCDDLIDKVERSRAFII